MIDENPTDAADVVESDQPSKPARKRPPRKAKQADPEPHAIAPAVAEPVNAAPPKRVRKTAPRKATSPVFAAEPVAEPSVTETPVAETPVAETPTADRPMIDQPIADPPAIAAADSSLGVVDAGTGSKAATKRTPRKRAAKSVPAAPESAAPESAAPESAAATALDGGVTSAETAPAQTAPAPTAPAETVPGETSVTQSSPLQTDSAPAVETNASGRGRRGRTTPALAAPPVLFQPPADVAPPRRRGSRTRKAVEPVLDELLLDPTEGDDDATLTVENFDEFDRLDDHRSDEGTTARDGSDPAEDEQSEGDDADYEQAEDDGSEDDSSDDDGSEDDNAAPASRRRRRRGRRGRGPRPTEDDVSETDVAQSEDDASDDSAAEDEDEADESTLSPSARRRRRRRRSTASPDAEVSEDDPPNTEVHVREPKSGSGRGSAADADGVRGIKGSTRLEAKRQRRRDSRDTGRRRAPILTEAEFLTRRESVERVMAVRQLANRTQIAVLEEGILVEHYVTRESAASAVGNVYLGRVQNVLPSMEAAFIDIGRGRNGVLYAGEVNWDAAGLDGKSRAIEHALNSGDQVLVQVTKDPIGHKGARLTSQISLPGRFVVYIPGGGMTGISRKLPDTERARLKSILKKVVPEDAGVIVRTAAEGASEADLVGDVERLMAQWEAIAAKSASGSSGPSLVYGEPDLAIRVVRDVFNDDFSQLIVSGSDSYATLSEYIGDIAPDLRDRLSLHTGESDLFADLRVDEQLAKALDRKVWLPSGGSLVIDRTEAMTVVDVNTGKYIGSGGNLEQTVTRNNLEAAEELVRQLRLRDIGGIVVIDFIDMVLESNRELVLRRLTECLGRDRTKHQVAEVTSLGLVQMTRKRVGEGLLEAFSEPCEHCKGRGVIIHGEPVVVDPDAVVPDFDEDRPGRNRRGRRGKTDVVGDRQVEVVLESQRRSAAAAIAAIAAATTAKEAEAVELESPTQDYSHAAGPAPTAGQGVTDLSPSVQDDPSSAAHPEPAPVEPDAVGTSSAKEIEFGESVNGSQPPAGATIEEPEVEQADEFGAASVTVTPVTVTPVTVTPRPRRRRGASRPAGPPVAVGAPPS